MASTYIQVSMPKVLREHIKRHPDVTVGKYLRALVMQDMQSPLNTEEIDKYEQMAKVVNAGAPVEAITPRVHIDVPQIKTREAEQIEEVVETKPTPVDSTSSTNGTKKKRPNLSNL